MAGHEEAADTLTPTLCLHCADSRPDQEAGAPVTVTLNQSRGDSEF